ncbi:MAG: class I SAM-dependent methyltransferase [Candidatus Woesearchaeota archaeon]|jgi:SAM-dependent methyltransferase
MSKLNLGCGEKILKGYVNIDIIPLQGVNIVHDLNKTPYPFKDNEFEEVYVDNVLEHLDNMSKIIKEIYRILKPNGKAIIKVPHFTSHDTWAHPQHTRAFAYDSFDFFVEGTWRYKKDGRCFPFTFKKIKRKLIFEKGLHPLNWHNYVIELIANIIPIWYEKTPLRIFPASSIEVVITK